MKIFRHTKRSNKLLSWFAVSSLIFFLASCSYDDKYTTDPNNPADVPIGLVLSQAEVGIGYTYYSDFARYDNMFTQQLAGVANQSLNIGHYNFKQQDTDQMWDNMYRALYSLQDVQRKATAAPQGSGGEYLALSYALKAFCFQVLTDHYGDIPFSDALRGDASLQPKYDKQEVIYPRLHVFLDSAITLADAAIATPSGVDSYVPNANTDPIFGGSMAQVKAFAQAMKARLYIHTVKRGSGDAEQAYNFATAALANGFETALVAFPGSGQTTENPFSQFNSQRGDVGVAQTYADSLVKFNDPRRFFYFDTSGYGEVVGAPVGEATTDFTFFGTYLNSANSPVYLFSKSELQFILAEAAFRTGKLGEAATATNAAITESFTQVGASGVDEYLANQGISETNISLKSIIINKWMSLYLDPEVWTDLRRTGYPELPLPANIESVNNAVPRRWPYPQKERNLNGPSVPQEPNPAISGRVWWDAD